jgi:dipeptidyl aminopeptidase/acylaminoacyl peptidase
VNELPGPVLYHSLSWSPSGKMFSFAYYSGEGSGLCLVEIDNLSERCMLADLYESGYHVAGSAWSPDENFIDFQFGQYPPYSIADFPPFHGVLNIITGEYFEIGETISESSWQP